MLVALFRPNFVLARLTFRSFAAFTFQQVYYNVKYPKFVKIYGAKRIAVKTCTTFTQVDFIGNVLVRINNGFSACFN